MGVQERKVREKHARQQAIVDAAQEIFLTKGIEQTTMDDIAEHTELSKGTIYLYFKSKEELYVSVFVKGLEMLSQQLQDLKQRFAGTPADALIRAVKEVYFTFYMQFPEYFYMNSLIYNGRIKEKIDPGLWTQSHEKTEECLQVFAEVIQKGIDEGLFRPVDPWKTANSFWGAGTGVMMMLNDEDHQKFVRIPVKELLDYTVELLLQSLQHRP